MIKVKEAVAEARNAAKDFFDNNPLVDLQLEEVEYDETTNTWMITLGFNVEDMSPVHGIGAAFSNQKYIRKYKLFKVNGETGKVMSMKIRKI